MFLHSAAAIILVIPVVMPLVNLVGIDPIHFGLVVAINLGIGQQTPPVASVLMVACSIAKSSVWEVTRVNLWFIGVLVAVLMLVTYVPVTGLALDDLFYRWWNGRGSAMADTQDHSGPLVGMRVLEGGQIMAEHTPG